MIDGQRGFIDINQTNRITVDEARKLVRALEDAVRFIDGDRGGSDDE